MSSRLRKLPPIVLALFVVLGVSACGDSHTKVTTGTYAGEAGKAAPYLNVGPLLYQVQVSRQLNPANEEDASYLQGLSATERQLGPGEEWFAMFVQVYNNNNQPYTDSDSFTITDTQENSYTPVSLGEANLYAYRPGTVPAKSQIPRPGTVPADFGPQGALLLFKIKIVSLDNRPMEVKITNPENPAESASAILDV
ncbi:MAG: hypothetical protein ABR992_01070 [Solirubrobacteraceae bacterium]|jgi:hypothetical protein